MIDVVIVVVVVGVKVGGGEGGGDSECVDVRRRRFEEVSTT